MPMGCSIYDCRVFSSIIFPSKKYTKQLMKISEMKENLFMFYFLNGNNFQNYCTYLRLIKCFQSSFISMNFPYKFV